MTAVDPKKLFRHLNSSTAAIAHTIGHLRFSSLQHFRESEDIARRDEQEGRASGPIEGGPYLHYASEDFPARTIYIMSFSECSKLPDFGCHVVILTNPEDFKDRVLKALPNGSHAYWGKVQYSDATNYNERPTGREVADRAELTKPTKFSAEREWRLVVRLPIEFRIISRQFDIRTYDQMEDLFIYSRWE